MGDRRYQFMPFQLQDSENTRNAVTAVDEIIQVRGGLSFDEACALYELASGLHNLPEQQGFVMEFGSCMGHSACIMGTALRNAKQKVSPYHYVIAIDPYTKEFPQYDDWYIKSRESYWKTGLALTHVCPVIYDDIQFLDIWNQPARVIFIDTTHTYEQTKQEIEKSTPYLIDGGWLVLHDYLHPEWSRVAVALHDFLDEQTDYVFDIYHVDSLIALQRRTSNVY